MVHTVYLSDRPVSFTVHPDETILAAGLREKLALPFGCRSGGCGSCRVRVEMGEVQHANPPAALSVEEREAGYILMCQAHPKTDMRIELHQPYSLDEVRPRNWPARVVHWRKIAHDVLELKLKLPSSDRPFRWVPGQYLDFITEDGRRSFSIASAPSNDTLELHLRIVPGGRFPQWIQTEMPDKAILRFEGPLGAFYIRDDADRKLIFVAGGTGFAPIRAMLQQLADEANPRALHLFWGVRAERDLYALEEIHGWQVLLPNLKFTAVLSEADDSWQGESGFVHECVLKHYPDLSNYEAYLSGPPIMVQSGKHAFIEAGLDPDHVFYDSFDYAHQTWPAQK